MTDDAVILTLDSSAPRQLGEDGLIVFWRDGCEPGQREGLACILSVCPHLECASSHLHVDGFVIDRPACAVRWDQNGIYLEMPPGSERPSRRLAGKMVAMVDPGSGETQAHTDLPHATDPGLLSWLASELDGELLDLLYRFWARAKGQRPEEQAKDIDLDEVEKFHFVFFDEFFDGVRPDEYFVAGHRYWMGLYLCPY
jgi:hypothetical protein